MTRIRADKEDRAGMAERAPLTIPAYAQEMVSATNGRMYASVVGKLKTLPIPEAPFPPVAGGLFLDIGCGWGRWMVSAARRGYLPVGIDLKLEAARATREILDALDLPGFALVCELDRLPFQAGVFDRVWSYSVLQHVNRARVLACLDCVARCLKPDGACMLEFPTRYGLWNVLSRFLHWNWKEPEPDSWVVRYYSIPELRRIMEGRLGTFSFRSHCYFGIGIQPVDLQFTPRRYHPLIRASMLLTALSERIKPLRWMADSVYVEGRNRARQAAEPAPRLEGRDNLEIVPLLRCPLTGASLRLDRASNRLIADESAIGYPVVDGIPILLADQAQRL